MSPYMHKEEEKKMYHKDSWKEPVGMRQKEDTLQKQTFQLEG